MQEKYTNKIKSYMAEVENSGKPISDTLAKIYAAALLYKN
jgi:hypothetical protein